MAFRFPPTLPRGVYERQRLGEHGKPGIRLSGMQQGFGKARQERDAIELYTRRLYGRPTRLHLLQPLYSAPMPVSAKPRMNVLRAPQNGTSSVVARATDASTECRTGL